MASKLFFITIICLVCMSPWTTFQSSLDKKRYIVLVDEPHGAKLTSLDHEDLNTYYKSFLSPLASTASSNNVVQNDPRIIHSYIHVFKGFSVMLTANELEDLKKNERVMFVWPERILSLHTTHSPKFLGLNQNIGGMWSGSNYGKGVIIGVLDTGIMPGHPSFSDYGMPPPPATWKGKSCQFMTTNFTCNSKIIGARSFMTKHNKTALDGHGHGTHTSSTAAGSFVKGANVFGNAQGTAAGIAPHAHLAIYKVCEPSGGCPSSAIIAGIDAAIEDGVDVLSISIGGDTVPFFNDSIAISTFRAMEKGIFVSLSAGNGGPSHRSVLNGAPWGLTVGASTIDREIRATVVLQGNNGQQFYGQTAFQPKGFPRTYLPLVYVQNCSSARSLTRARISGKIVVCEVLEKLIGEGKAVKNAGGAAMILVNFEEWANTTISVAHVLPAAHVGYADGFKIKAYINSMTTPVAKISFGGTVIGDNNIRAPVVAAFSSRGPNPLSTGILKPDILGPGVNILAAWPTSVENITNTKSTFNIKSGTSMSCPHLSGVVALIKSVHPDWSPAAIKSAIMTTADVVDHALGPIEDERFLPADIFAIGAGHVNPQAATNPGLIYDIKPEDYIPYLCGLNYTDKQVQLFSNNKSTSCLVVKSVPEAQLNYPSFALTFTGPAAKPQTYTRTVTNVGNPHSSNYNVTVVSLPGIDVRVAPKKLNFSKLNQEMKYKVTFSRKASSALNGTAVKGFLKLCSSKQCVTSPIAVILQ